MYDIFFIGKGTPEVDADYASLKKISPFAKQVTTFEEAQQRSFTTMFWAVFPGVVVDPSFEFNYAPPEYDQQYVHIWPSHHKHIPPSVILFPKNKSVSKRELGHRFFIGMIKMDVVATRPKAYDIVFISFYESYADQHFRKLKMHPSIFSNRVLRVEGVKGIHAAHIEAARIANTDMVWIVDADAEILPSFNFEFTLTPEELDIVHVWRSKNPINDLEYGYGGVKLLPRLLTLNMDTSKPDMTTSISSRFKVMDEVSNITAFNTDPLNTWRSAFRECAKLSSRIIPGQVNDETENRLQAWLTTGYNHLYGDYARAGASAGEWFGKTYRTDPAMLSKINDYDWLSLEFEQHSKLFPVETFR